MRRAVVVGAGISGLLASFLLKKKFDEVMIIENSEYTGGLLRSVQDDAGLFYDQGTHIPDLTGIKVVDEIIFGPEEKRKTDWYEYSHLYSGNYFNGCWNLETQTLNISTLNKRLRNQIEAQIKKNKTQLIGESLEGYLETRFGEIAVKEIFTPIFKKLYGQSVKMEKLVSRIGKGRFFIFGLDRVVAFSRMETKRLKKNPVFDSKLAFHTNTEFLEYMKDLGIEQRFLYPKKGRGVGSIIEGLLERANKSGIIIKTNAKICRIESQADKITGLRLSENNQVINCDHVFWTVPPSFGLIATGEKIQAQNLKFRCSNIFHFCFDKPITNNVSHFLWSWDTNDPIFRITLYDNFRRLKKQNCHQVTVECLSDKEDCNQITSELVIDSLINMGLLEKDTKVISREEQRLKNTFPVPDFNFKQSSEQNYEAFRNLFSNLSISGRYSGKVWLQQEVLIDTYNQIEKLD